MKQADGRQSEHRPSDGILIAEVLRPGGDFPLQLAFCEQLRINMENEMEDLAFDAGVFLSGGSEAHENSFFCRAVGARPSGLLYNTRSIEHVLQSLDCEARSRQASRAMARSLPPDPDLGRALRQLREARGMTQEEVAHAADLTLGAYGRIEREEVAPAWPTVRAIARGLGISMEELGAAVDRRGR